MSSRLLFAAALLGAAFLACGCEQKSAPAPATKAQPSARPAAPAAASTPSPAPPLEEAPEVEAKVVAERPAKGGKPSWIELGDVNEIGPAGAASASAQGVVMVTKTGELLLVPPARFKTPLDKAEAEFAPTARGPAVAGDFAYFVLASKLVRRRLDGAGTLETLADDARDGARVSALPQDGKQPAVAAYITRPDKEGTSLAKVWLNGRTLTLTADGAGASSVALVRNESKVLALSIDGRSAMTPVHARPLELEAKEPALGNDQVVWVAGSAQSLTEITSGSDGKQVWGFLPIAQDASHFGLAELGLPAGGQGDADVSWRLYDNGIDLAPISAAKICGSLLLVYARPQGASPRSPQELVLSRAGSNETAVIVSAQGFANASLASSDSKGGLLVYVADRHTFALPLRCPA